MFSFLLLILVFSAHSVRAATNVSGVIAADIVWTLSGSPYIVTGNVTVQGADGADGITTLTIEPGAQVRFNGNYSLTIGGSSGSPGALIAQGTTETPIIFTSHQATPAPGNWSKIQFANTSDDAASVMNHCVVEYAGNPGAIYLLNASPTIQNTTIRYGLYAGVYAASSASVLTGNTISNCATRGIYWSGGSPSINATVFSANGTYDIYLTNVASASITGCAISHGIYMDGGVLQTITGNTITYNNNYPVRLVADGIGQLHAANTITGMDAQSVIEVTGGTISHDSVWSAGLSYVMQGAVIVQGADGTDGITTLTIEPGAQVRFNGNYSLTIGGSTGSPGALIAQGTTENPILFTSHKTVPTAGDWSKIQFANTSDDAASMMNHCVVEYAGNPGAIYLLNASPTIQNTTIRNGQYAAIYITGSGCGTAVIRCNTFTLNARGVYNSANPAPQLMQNNFIANAMQGIYHTGSGILNAENNWWNSAQGPNTGGDTTFGNVDADPWSPAQNQCNELEPNLPPNPPAAPSPADGAVRVSATSGISLVWTCADPNVLDTLSYDLFWGTTADALAPQATDLVSNTYTQSGASPGTTYYWKVVAKDDKGAATAGPVWHFTTTGDPPDLIVSGLSTQPAGHIQTGQNVTLTATVQNIGTGPVVDAFAVQFKLDGTTIATPGIGDVLLAGQSQTASASFAYSSGDPSINVKADSAGAVSETNEQNNQFIALLSAVADNTPPTLTGTSPIDGAFQQQIQQISATLTDSQSTINTTAVTSGFTVTNSALNPVAGTVHSSGDTFTFVPTTLPLADDIYTAHLTAADIHGNTRPLSFSFTIDTVPPAKPAITGGTVASGVIQARPAQNTADQFIVQLTGTREADTSVWIGNARHVTVGSAAWSSPLTLEPDNNAFEVWLVDRAGNRGASEWVDIAISTGSGIVYEYNAAGRLKRVSQPEE